MDGDKMNTKGETALCRTGLLVMCPGLQFPPKRKPFKLYWRVTIINIQSHVYVKLITCHVHCKISLVQLEKPKATHGDHIARTVSVNAK